MGSFCFLQSFCLPKSVFVVLFLFWLFYFYRALLVPWRLCQRYLNWLTWRLSTHEPSMAGKQTLLWQPRTHKIFGNREGWSSLNVISCWKCWEKKSYLRNFSKSIHRKTDDAKHMFSKFFRRGGKVRFFSLIHDNGILPQLWSQHFPA